MANVVRFALSTAKTLYVPGAGTFIAGILDVDANNLALLTKTRYLVQPYRAVELGTVDASTPKPSLPAVPGPPAPDPYPQYLTPAEAAASPELRAAFDARFQPVEQLQRVAYLGDSLSINAATVINAAINWAGVARALLGARYDHSVQAGVGGETAAQILSRVGTVTGANPKPSICVVHAGLNSITAGSATPAATVIAQLTQIITALRTAGITPVLLTLVPSNFVTGTLVAEYAKVNEWIRNLSRTMGVHSIDWTAAVADWAATTPTWTAALTADGVHPNERGHLILGRAVAAGLAPLITGPSSLPSGAGLGHGVLTPNPGMTGSGGTNTSGLTGTVPASWTLRQTGTGSVGTATVVPRIDGVGGNWLELALTRAPGVELFAQNTAVGVDWNVGDTVVAEAELLLPVAPVNLRRADLRLDFWNAVGSVAQASFAMPPSTALDLPAITDRPIVLRTPPMVVPAGTARLQLYAALNEAATTGVAITARWGRVAIRKV